LNETPNDLIRNFLKYNETEILFQFFFPFFSAFFPFFGKKLPVEGKDTFFVVIPAGAEYGGGKLRPVGGIGEMLGFQAKSRLLAVDRAGLARNTGEEIPRIELDPRLGGKKPHRSA
jgi:hypothetical protein